MKNSTFKILKKAVTISSLKSLFNHFIKVFNFFCPEEFNNKKFSKFKYKILRLIFNSPYFNKENYLSKIFFEKDSFHLNLKIVK